MVRIPEGGSRHGVAWLYGRRRARLATVDPAGDPHCVPVIYGFDPRRGRLWFMAAAASRKVRNIERTAKAAVTVDDEEAMRGVALGGRASVVRDPAERQRVMGWLIERGVLSATRDVSAQVPVAVDVGWWAEWGLAPAAEA